MTLMNLVSSTVVLLLLSCHLLSCSTQTSVNVAQTSVFYSRYADHQNPNVVEQYTQWYRKLRHLSTADFSSSEPPKANMMKNGHHSHSSRFHHLHHQPDHNVHTSLQDYYQHHHLRRKDANGESSSSQFNHPSAYSYHPRFHQITRTPDPVIIKHSTSKQNRTSTKFIPYNCTSLPKTASNRWLLTEGETAGLCNQLSMIYSYFAAAFYFNSSIILDGLYSRKSFEIHWPLQRTEWTQLPFSAFFDLPYFIQFWKQRGIDIIESTQYYHCPDESLSSIVIERRPIFWPTSFKERMEMIQYNNLTVPLPENSIITIKAPHPFLTFGNLFEFPSLMMDIHLSLQPSPLLYKYIELIVNYLPTNFIVAHLRIEGDVYSIGDKTKEEVMQRIDEAILYMIQNTTCFSSLSRDSRGRLLNPPPLYLASGIFTNQLHFVDLFYNHTLPLVEIHSKELNISALTIVQYTLLKLYEVGIKVIYSKEIVMAQIQQKSTIEDQVEIDFLMFHSLFPEQLAYIDLQIARHSSCFSDANIPSTFSYFVLRQRAWDRHEDLHISDITPQKYKHHSVFGAWGM